MNIKYIDQDWAKHYYTGCLKMFRGLNRLKSKKLKIKKYQHLNSVQFKLFKGIGKILETTGQLEYVPIPMKRSGLCIVRKWNNINFHETIKCCTGYEKQVFYIICCRNSCQLSEVVTPFVAPHLPPIVCVIGVLLLTETKSQYHFQKVKNSKRLLLKCVLMHIFGFFAVVRVRQSQFPF